MLTRDPANASYRLARAFAENTPVNEGNLGRALAAFQRTLVASNTPFDRYMRGDATALSPEQVRGMERFQSVGCINFYQRISRGGGRRGGGRGRVENPQVSRDQIDPLARQLNMRGRGQRCLVLSAGTRLSSTEYLKARARAGFDVGAG